MHVIDAARTGGHAGEAGEAAVDVVGHRRRHLALLEHLLHQVDAAARAVALIAGEHIGRAGRGAEAAMHAALQDRIGARDGRIGELNLVESGLHRFAYIPEYMRPGLRMPTGSKATAGTSDCRLASSRRLSRKSWCAISISAPRGARAAIAAAAELKNRSHSEYVRQALPRCLAADGMRLRRLGAIPQHASRAHTNPEREPHEIQAAT
jgi:hypothetical protein